MTMGPRPPAFPLSRTERQGRLLFFLSLAAVTLWLAFGSWPGKRSPLLGAPCIFKQVSGLPCAFCGGTRATRQILKGNFEKALYLNAIAFPTVVGIALVSLGLLYEAVRGRALFPRPAPKTHLVLVLCGVGFLAAWTVWHAWDALSTPKPELINLKHPLVKFIREKSGLIPES